MVTCEFRFLRVFSFRSGWPITDLSTLFKSKYDFLFYRHTDHPNLPSFPTRRSSDLTIAGCTPSRLAILTITGSCDCQDCQPDRKSTRLNSSHITSSYAVFCLKKKKSIS